MKKNMMDNFLISYNMLNKEQQQSLKRQIKKINFKKMYKLYKNSYKDDFIDINKIEPLNVIQKSNTYKNIGIEFIKKNRYAIVIMAGGSGSRLGFKGPKGCFELNIDNRFISLFEIYISQLKKVIREYNIVIPIYIMTSTFNNEETINYFKKHNYFNYPKNKIKFFQQDNLPILNIDGKILLKDESNILFGPNGNGDVFKSLKRNKLLKDMIKNNIQYTLFINIDNILNDLVDFDFLGSVISNDYKLASKTIKIDEKKEWVFCKYKKRPFMLPVEFLSNKLFNIKKDDKYIYRFKNISYHLIHIDLVKKFSKKNLPYHRAYKKSIYINSPNKPNSFKFEKFIFDAFYYADDMLLYETDYNDFCPIKRIDDIEASIALYQKK